jgi:hypothetical protein
MGLVVSIWNAVSNPLLFRRTETNIENADDMARTAALQAANETHH